MKNVPAGNSECTQCKGAGKYTPYFGMGGDHGEEERTCSKCNGRGYFPLASALSALANEQENKRLTVAPLASLSRQYVEAAGKAFAERDDKRAISYREAADKLDQLARELPPLNLKGTPR